MKSDIARLDPYQNLILTAISIKSFSLYIFFISLKIWLYLENFKGNYDNG